MGGASCGRSGCLPSGGRLSKAGRAIAHGPCSNYRRGAVTRPVPMTLIQSLRARLGRKFRPRREVTVASGEDLIELAHWIERPQLRLMVPPDLLRMQGAFVYGGKHPFVAALTGGEQNLRDFYAACRPASICEYYGIEGGGRSGADLEPWEIPWYGRWHRLPPPGELELGPEHGVSFYGPVSDFKIALEMRRLETLADGVRKGGYDPDAFGDIEGYILSDGERAVFFVRGGKHRAAVLTALGHAAIPVAFRPSWPRLVHLADAAHWPLVRSGCMEISLAKDVFDVYIRGRTE